MVVETIFLLAIAHAVTDFALQGQGFAGKVPESPVWPLVLTAHALVNAGGVLVVTGSTWLAVAELIVHWVTDFLRTRRRISPYVDQAIHGSSKLAWALWLAG